MSSSSSSAAEGCSDDDGSGLPQQAGPTVDWQTALAVLYIVQERVCWGVRRPVVFTEAVLATLRAHFDADHMHFWTVVDQFQERLLLAPWDAVPPGAESAHAAAVLARVHPVPCDIPEVDFVQSLLHRWWGDDTCNGVGVGVDDCGQEDNYFDDHGNGNNIDGNGTNMTTEEEGEEEEEEEEEEDRAARAQMIRLAEQNVYTWEAAEQVVAKISARLAERAGAAVPFDAKHLAALRALHRADALGFWSVLDQVQARLMAADWAEVRNPSRFVQGVLGAALAPSAAPLSPFMAAAVPAHSLVPYGQPPTYLRTVNIRALGGGGAVSSQRGSSRWVGSTQYGQQQNGQLHHKQRQQHQQQFHHHHEQEYEQEQQQHQPKQQQLLGPNVTMNTVDPEANYPYCWRAVLEAIAAIEARLRAKFGRRIVFDEKHKQDLFARWLDNAKGFFSVLDQIQERLYQTNWDTVRDDGRYIQSLIAKFDPQTVVSTFIQSFVTPPEVAAAAAAAARKVAALIDLDWDTIAREVVPALEARVSDCVGHEVRFDDKHKQHLKQRYDRDPQAFWSVLDQVQERMAASDWSNVRTPQRFIQSFITKAQPAQTFTPSTYLEHVLRTVHEHGDACAVWPALKASLSAPAPPPLPPSTPGS